MVLPRESRAVSPLPRQRHLYFENYFYCPQGRSWSVEKLANSQSKSQKKSKATQNEPPRSWVNSITFSAIAVVVVMVVAVVVNLAIGRVIHWDIVTAFGVIGFVFLSIGRKYRSI
jgi:hypothetical protein